MHQYTCPTCKVVLKREQPVAAGKKIKCPKCQAVFAPPSPVASRPVAGKPVLEEDDRNPYKVSSDSEEDDTVKAEKQRAAAGIIKDRFKKSKRGPAQAKVVAPSGWMTAWAVFCGIIYIIMFVVGLFPMVFRSYYMENVKPDVYEAVWQATVTKSIILMVGACVGFVYASLVMVAAFKMRTLESYSWAMVGAILCIAFGGCLGFFIGIWALMTLLDQAVKDGFAEEPPPPI